MVLVSAAAFYVTHPAGAGPVTVPGTTPLNSAAEGAGWLNVAGVLVFRHSSDQKKNVLDSCFL